MATKQRRRRPLTKERVLQKAIAVADKDGIEALSMRRLGQALGVEAMSLYKYVANKGELVAAMVDSVVEQFELPDDEPAWNVAIRRCAVRAHDVLLEHPWACRLALVPSDVHTISGPRIRYMEWLLKRLREAGFSQQLAYSAYHTLDSHIFGFTLWQIGHADATKAFVVADGEPLEEFFARILEEMRPSYPYLVEHGEQHMAPGAPNGKQEFEFGLDLILDGLERRRKSAG
jgi:AcrR family transcriptional regulator